MNSRTVPSAPRPVAARSLYSPELLEAIGRWRGIAVRPDRTNRLHRDGIRIFRLRWMEVLLTKAPPVVPWVFSLPIIAFGIYHGLVIVGTGPAGTLGLFGAGILLWTLIEYLLHRFLFHLRPRGPRSKAFLFLAHGYHHEFPDDKLRLVAPPLMFWSLAAAVSLLYGVVFGSRYWAQLFAGTTAGYLAYDCIHYYTHHAVPRNPVGRWLRRYHLLHHFEDNDERYGISSPLWDLVFRTFRAPGR